MRYRLLTLFLLLLFLPVSAPANDSGAGPHQTRLEYKELADHLACPLPRKPPSAAAEEGSATRVRLALSSRLVKPPTEEDEDLEQQERLSIFIGLRCLLD